MSYYIENDRVLRARILVKDFPTSVINFLATVVEEHKVVEEFQACCIREDKDPRDVMTAARAGLNQSTFVNDPRQPQSSMSPPPPPSHGLAILRDQHALPTPPATTAGSVASHGRRYSNEVFISVIDGNDERKRLSMLKADVQYNWIRADIVRDRLKLEPKRCEGSGFVETRYGNYTGRCLHAGEQVGIDFQMHGSMRTEHIECFLAYDDIDADIIMGKEPAIPTSMNMNASRASSVASPQPQMSRTFPVEAHDRRDLTAGQRSTNFSMGDSTLRRFAEANVTTGMPTEPFDAAEPHAQHARGQHETTWQTAPTSSQSPYDRDCPALRTAAAASSWSVSVRIKWNGKLDRLIIDSNISHEDVLARIKDLYPTPDFDRSTLRLWLSTSRNRGVDVDKVPVSFNQRDMLEDWQDARDWIAEHANVPIYGDIGSVDAPG